MQVKESAYIEAARSYGASSSRIIFPYMIPRLIPMLIPQFIVLIPAYVFLEASLAVLGWAIRPCPPGARSSMIRIATGRSSRAGITGCWSHPRC